MTPCALVCNIFSLTPPGAMNSIDISNYNIMHEMCGNRSCTHLVKLLLEKIPIHQREKILTTGQGILIPKDIAILFNNQELLDLL